MKIVDEPLLVLLVRLQLALYVVFAFLLANNRPNDFRFDVDWLGLFELLQFDCSGLREGQLRPDSFAAHCLQLPIDDELMDDCG